MTKRERVEAILRGEKADMIPAAFWYHYSSKLDPAQMAEEHLKTFRETGADLYKVMMEYRQKLDADIQTPSDWKKVKYPDISSPVFKQFTDVIKRILDATGGDALLFQTVFGPLKVLVHNYGWDLIMAHAKEAPDLLAGAAKVAAEALTEWAAGFIEAGADGLFYSGQFSEPGRFTRELFEKLTGQGDIQILKAAEAKGGRNILHICGEPEYEHRVNPEWYAHYPAAIVNWSVKDSGLSLEDGRKLFGSKPILGGMNNRGNILNGSDESIADEVRAVIASLNSTQGFMLGADCAIQGKGITHERIRVAVDTAHALT